MNYTTNLIIITNTIVYTVELSTKKYARVNARRGKLPEKKTLNSHVEVENATKCNVNQSI